MKLFIKNKFISLGGSSRVYDENDNEVYFVKGRMISITRKKFVQTLDGERLFTVRNKVIRFLRRKALILDANNKPVATIIKRFTIKQQFDVVGTDKPIQIQGNWIGWNFNVVYGDELIGTIRRKFALTDTFELDVADEDDAAFLVAIVIAIDNIYDKRSAEASSND